MNEGGIMDIAVIDYSTSTISVYRNVKTDNPEDWVINNTSYDADTCYWMCSSSGIQIRED